MPRLPLFLPLCPGAEKAPHMALGVFRRRVRCGRWGRCEHCAKRFLFGAVLAAPSPQPPYRHYFITATAAAVNPSSSALISFDLGNTAGACEPRDPIRTDNSSTPPISPCFHPHSCVGRSGPGACWGPSILVLPSHYRFQVSLPSAEPQSPELGSR